MPRLAIKYQFTLKSMRKYFILALISFLLTPIFPSQAETKPVDLYIFTRTGCSHCANALNFLNNYKTSANQNLIIHEFDMVAHPEYADKFFQFAAAYQSPSNAVPIIFIGDKFVAGDKIDQIKMLLDDCNLRACVNPEQYVANQNQHSAVPPQTKIPAAASRSIIGYAVLGVIIVGAGLIAMNKFF